ncbi:MAG: Crp/Fnr family transcriptional regulator [Bacteroidales bacterium]|nr:Crp/Fnr family transcriptional regulator [Bacteroidales bacterium]
MTELQLNVLSESAVFTGIPDAIIDEILHGEVYQVKTFPGGTVIAQSGANCNHVRVILEGHVAGEMMDMSGKILKIEDLGPSKMIAPAFLYGRRKTYPVNVISSDEVTLWQMHRDDFSRLLQKDIRLLNNFLNAISNRAQFLSEKIRFLSFPTLRAKLAYLFLQYAAGEPAFRLPMTHQQLSELFGVARPSLTREIRQMNNEGLIVAERDMIRIPDMQRLKVLLNRQ